MYFATNEVISVLLQVMWTKRWKISFPSIFSLELDLFLDPPLFPPPVVVLVPPRPTVNLQAPAGLVVQHNHPDPHKVNTA